MRILIVSPTHKGIGGVARHVQGLVNFLKQNNCKVDVISSDNSFTIPVRKLQNPSFMLSSFLKTLLKKDYDIIHTQNFPAALALKAAHGKKILSLHGIHHQQVKLLHGNTMGEISKRFEKYALKWADVVTVSSHELYEHYLKLGINAKYLPNAIDVAGLSSGIDRRYEKQIV